MTKIEVANSQIFVNGNWIGHLFPLPCHKGKAFAYGLSRPEETLSAEELRAVAAALDYINSGNKLPNGVMEAKGYKT